MMPKYVLSGEVKVKQLEGGAAIVEFPSVSSRRGAIELTLARPGYERMKRIMDVTISLLVLLGLSPLWLLVALVIKLTSEGPALYVAKAIGRHGRPFQYYKFRTMRVQNDNSEHRRFIQQYVRNDKPYAVRINRKNGKESPVYKLVNDQRVTWIGRLLRKTSLDEVPQLLNVLRGQMSVIGPRPPLDYEYELYDDQAKQRLAVLPGITGLTQVTARSEASFSEMVRTDLYYIAHRSLWVDLRILARTLVVILFARGAH